jgi:NAD-dependent SIR2 family protein deacetylase|tara:strand:+ start:155 stop:487 length:333 start_codon:yes stop_codon:yes gene_type:complete
MAVFASGKYALAICDRCGQQYKFLQLKKEWNDLQVCPECYEPKHPQLEPSHHEADAQALPFTRPAREEPVIVNVGAPGDSAFESNGMQPSTESKKLIITMKVGNVTVSTS